MVPHRELPRVLVLTFVFLCSPLGFSAFAQESSGNEFPKLFWVETITPDGKLLLREYTVSSTQTLDFPDLEIWPKSLGRNDPFPLYSGTLPNLRLKLLESGLARLKDEASAPAKYIEAQNTAKSRGSGMWPKPEPTPGKSIPETAISSPVNPAPSTAAEPSPIDPVQIVSSWNWNRILKILLAVAGLIGLPAIGKVFLLWRRRHRVPLVFVGLRSTGKSWLWNRISDPDITEEELNRIPATELLVRKKAAVKKPMGKYEIVPVYYDIAGGQAGQQVTTLLDENRRFQRLRRLLAPKKSVWILMLATTQDKNVTINSPSSDKVDASFISEQLGHLYLPMGILSSKVTPKPQMVIVSIGKFDIFETLIQTTQLLGRPEANWRRYPPAYWSRPSGV